MADHAAIRRQKLGRILAFAFVVVLALGAGPGLLLVNPDPTDPAVSYTILGLPKVYAWGLLCYGAEVVIVVIAYFKVWHDDDEKGPM